MNAPFFLVCEPANDLLITAARYNDWRELADAGGVIVWNREGRVRRVSNAVLDNALHIYREHTLLMTNNRLFAMPKGSDRILWEQADAINHQTSR